MTQAFRQLGLTVDGSRFVQQYLYRMPTDLVAEVLDGMLLLSYGMMELLRDFGPEPQITSELLSQRLPGILPHLQMGIPDFVSAHVGQDEHGPVIVVRTSRFLDAREKMQASHLAFKHPVVFEVA
jgi:hypothetical protein